MRIETRRVSKIGNSYSITLPIDWVRKHGVRNVTLVVEDDKIIILARAELLLRREVG